jgi:2-haloacid dehalogenase
MLQYSLVMTVSEQHASLPNIGAAVLEMMAKNMDVVLTSEEAKRALEPMLTLPSFPDVRPGLEKLKQHGFRLATLTNSSQAGVKAQMEHAGLTDCFEQQLSVESVGRYKPHRAVYEWAASEMQCQPSRCMLVAAHGWDVAGAKWAGLQTAFINRAGQQLFPLGPKPDIHVADIVALADQLCS